MNFEIIGRIEPSKPNRIAIHVAGKPCIDPHGGRATNPDIVCIGFTSFAEAVSYSERANFKIEVCGHCKPDLP